MTAREERVNQLMQIVVKAMIAANADDNEVFWTTTSLLMNVIRGSLALSTDPPKTRAAIREALYRLLMEVPDEGKAN